MIELLRMCGYDDQAIELKLSRIEKVFNLLGIDRSDIDRGKTRLNTYYNMNLESVKKGVQLCIENVADLALAREDGKKKLIYYYMAPGMEILGTTLLTKSRDILVENLNGPLQFLLGGIFDKLVPVLEAAEKKWLKSGKAYHCANVKASLGFLSLEIIPKPDILIASGHLCDTAPKSTDLIHELFDIPVCTYDACVDLDFSEHPDYGRVLEFASKSARHLAEKIGEVVGFDITDSMVMESIKARDEIGEKNREIKTIMDTSDPVPISFAHDILWNCVSTMSFGINDLGKQVEVLNTAISEMKMMVDNGEGLLKKGSPRVLALLPPHYSDPRWEQLPYEYGISLVSCETGFFAPNGERDPEIKEELCDDPYILMVVGLQSSLNQSIRARSETIVGACRRLNVDGVLGKYHVGCRINVADALIIKEAITKEIGIPVLLLEWEGFDPRVMNEAQYRKELDAFREVMESNRRDGHK